MRTIQVYPERDAQLTPTGDWRWRKIGGSDIVADSGEGYSSKEGAVKAAERERTGDDVVMVWDENANDYAEVSHG